MKKQYRIIKILEPNGNCHYVVQQSYWLFGTRWRAAIREGCGPPGDGAIWPKEFDTIEAAKKGLEILRTPRTYEVVEEINDN